MQKQQNATAVPAFLFDLDGTLVDSVYQHVLAWREALEKGGIELSVWRIHRRIGMSGGLFVNLEGERLGVCELRSTIETQTRNAEDGEFHREDFAFLATGKIARGFVNRCYLAVGKRGGVEARRILRILVKPKADGVLCFRIAHKTTCGDQ